MIIGLLIVAAFTALVVGIFFKLHDLGEFICNQLEELGVHLRPRKRVQPTVAQIFPTTWVTTSPSSEEYRTQVRKLLIEWNKSVYPPQGPLKTALNEHPPEGGASHADRDLGVAGQEHGRGAAAGGDPRLWRPPVHFT